MPTQIPESRYFPENQEVSHPYTGSTGSSSRTKSQSFVDYVIQPAGSKYLRYEHIFMCVVGLVIVVYLSAKISDPNRVTKTDMEQTKSINQLSDAQSQISNTMLSNFKLQQEQMNQFTNSLLTLSNLQAKRFDEQNRKLINLEDSLTETTKAVKTLVVRERKTEMRIEDVSRQYHGQPSSSPDSTDKSRKIPIITPSAAANDATREKQNTATLQAHPRTEHIYNFNLTPPVNVIVRNISDLGKVWAFPITPNDDKETYFLPIANTAMGIYAHNVQDNHDYFITPSGGWMRINQ